MQVKLFKVSEQGKILEWVIWQDGCMVITKWGENTSAKQTANYEAKETNVGRSNYRTAGEQATFEMQSKIEEQLKYKGYFNTLEEALTASKKSIKGMNNSIKPMKAQKFENFANKLIFPCFCQAKYDGNRCIAIKASEKVTLFSSMGNEITQFEHIRQQLNEIMRNGEILDGELYAHGIELKVITGICKRHEKQTADNYYDLKFYCFDAVKIAGYSQEDYFSKRFAEAARRIKEFYSNSAIENKYILVAPTFLINNYKQADKLYLDLIEKGYEGLMYRRIDMKYSQKRSQEIIKRKGFREDEYLIVDVQDGIGKDKGVASKFILQNEFGESFSCSLNCSYDKKRDYYNDQSLWNKKFMTVRYLQDYNGIPQIAKGVCIRDYE